MRKFMLATALAVLATPALAQPPGLWDHNGSAMQLIRNGNGNLAVIYEVVRPGLRQTIPPGAPRFEGQQIGNRLIGNAFVYTKHCPGSRFPYHVEGVANGSVIELWGPAAVVDPWTCQIVGLRADSDNAHIVFTLVQPSVVEVPPPVVVAPPPPVVVPPVVVPQQPPIVVTPSCTGICAPIYPPAPPPVVVPVPTPESPDAEAERLERLAREFCYRNPGHPKCATAAVAPAPAVPVIPIPEK